MLISNEKMKNVDEFMKKLDDDMRERKLTDFRMTRIRLQLKAMSRDRESIERSKDEQRIGRFNKLFIANLAELSKLMQTHGFSNRDEIADLVRKAKAQ